MLPRRKSATADAFTMTIGTAVFDKRAGAGRALQHHLAELARDLGYRREAVVPVGTLAGLQVEAHAVHCSSGIELTVRFKGRPLHLRGAAGRLPA